MGCSDIEKRVLLLELPFHGLLDRIGEVQIFEEAAFVEPLVEIFDKNENRRNLCLYLWPWVRFLCFGLCKELIQDLNSVLEPRDLFLECLRVDLSFDLL